MKTVWNKGLNAQQKIEMKNNFEAASLLRHRLSELLKEKESANRNAVRSSTSYESPNWALVQADSIGYERALKEVISLLS